MQLSRNLLRLGWAQRGYFALAALLGIVGGISSIWQANAFSQVIQQVFILHFGIEEVRWGLISLLVVMLCRALLMGGQEAFSAIGVYHLKINLRQRLSSVFPRIGVTQVGKETTGELAQTYLEGVDALEAYFGQYIPQVLMAAWIPPIILIAVFLIDPISGVFFLVTGPLIPFFMGLIGDVANQQTQRQWQKLSTLSAFLLEAIQALPVLKRLGITAEFVEKLAQKGDAYRKATLQVLRVSFLSALVLELLTTLSTAVVAVQVGLRLLYGSIPFEQALFVLVIAPEFYLPLRLLGQRFHAGMSGVAGGERINQILQMSDAASNELELEKTLLHHTRQIEIIENIHQGIYFDQVGFTQPERGQILENIQFKLEPGEITVLTGESGSGKTTLVNLLLGFIKPTQGKIYIGSLPLEKINLEDWWNEIGWVPQQPYFFLGTIYENLCFGNSAVTQDQVNEAAQLAHADEFIMRFPLGYQTVIGEGGIGLSAGQAQRIALARAYLRKPHLLILDEGSANIDAQSLTAILRSLTETKADRITLLVTHQPQVMAVADKILQIEKTQLGEIRQKKISDSLELNQKYNLSLENLESFDQEDSNYQLESLAYPQSFPSPISAEGSKHEISRLIQFIKPLWGWVFLAVTLSVAAILSNVGLMYTSAFIISSAALQPSIATLQVAIVGVRFFGISRGVWRYFERLISHRVTLDLLNRMRVWFYQALEPLLPKLFLRYPSGDLMSRLLGDIAALEPFYIRVVSPFLSALVIGIGLPLILSFFNLKLAFWLLILFGFASLGCPFLYQGLSEKFVGRISELRGELNSSLVNMIQGLGELLVNRTYPRFENRTNKLAQNYGQVQLRFALLLSSQAFLMNGLAYFGMWLTLWVTIPQVKQGQISGTILAGLGLAVYASFEAFMGLPNAAQVLVNSRKAAGRLFELSDQNELLERKFLQTISVQTPLAITFENVSFSYPVELSNKEIDHQRPIFLPALVDINLQIPYGQKVAIVGASGAGKTTLLYLMMGLFFPDQGKVRMNGVDLEDLDLVSLRKNIASSGQDDFLFHDTLESNLCILNPNATPIQIEKALQAACLEDLVTALPEGLNTIIGEQGKQLSGGERKRVLIARTLLRDASVYIFDEPLSQLDEKTACQIVHNIVTWTDQKTLIWISHLDWGLEEMDEIVVVDNGQIIKKGKIQDIKV